MGLFGEPWQDESQRLGHSGESCLSRNKAVGARTALLEE